MDAASESPSCRDVRSERPYNEDKVTLQETLAQLKKDHPRFCGDWSQLETFMHYYQEGQGNAWRRWTNAADSRGEFIHLEGVSLARLRLQHYELRGAHLEGANLQDAELQQANLTRAYLDKANLLGAHLEKATLLRAHLNGAVLKGAHFEEANLNKAQLDSADLQDAHLQGADLHSATLRKANMARACVERAYLQEADLDGANLTSARLEAAALVAAHFEGAKLKDAALDGADVRGATGLRFDENRVFRIHIEGNAPDRWSVLRRKYTGPWFFIHLLLLVLFFAPYAGRVLALSAVAHGQAWMERKSDELVTALDERSPEAATQAQSALSRARAEFHARFRQMRAAWVLVGGTRGWWAVSLAGVVFVYNMLRLLLTLHVGTLRDAEERSSITPRLIEYAGRPWAREPRWKGFRAALGQLGLSLWQLHCVARVLLYVALASVVVNTVIWICTTTVPVPLPQ